MWLREFPQRVEEVVLDGFQLGLDQVVSVARYRARVRLCDSARERVERGRTVVDRLVENGTKVYGLTTGFGSKRDILIPPEALERLQVNLIRSHACGVGEPLAEDQVRAAMLLRANTLARGNSGVRAEVIEAILGFLNRDVYPWIPSRGSLGASGDLAPLSHLALALCNDPDARFYERNRKEPAPWGPVVGGEKTPDYIGEPASWAFGPAPGDLFGGKNGLAPLVLQAKEGLALNNGTQVSVAIGLLTLFDAVVLLESAEMVCGLSIEAIMGVRGAFDPRLHQARPLPGQSETAANILAFTEESQVLTLPINTARLHRARWALAGAREILAGNPDSADLTRRIREVEDLLVAFEDRVVSVLDADAGAGISEEERIQQTYRQALAPIRAEVLSVYAASLEQPFRDEGGKGRDFLADAVAQLQLALPESPSVQDDYSFRCTPQVLGAVRATVENTGRVLLTEANSATDNPLIFPPRLESFKGTVEEYRGSLTLGECRAAVVSGGNFHGEPIAMALDHLSIALAELGNISERRTAHLVDGDMSNGLPSLLVWESGLNSGLMIPQYVAASLVSENKVLSHPASVDSIPTCESTEDHVSMSALAALKCRQILQNVQTVVAIELLTAFQGVYFRRPLACGRGTERLWQSMRENGMTPVREDRVLYRDIEWAREYLLTGRVWEIARELSPPVVN